MTEPKPGQVWVKNHTTYKILETSEDTLTLNEKSTQQTITKPRSQFLDNATHHQSCTNCDLPVNPNEAPQRDLHYQCWYQQATVNERCEAEHDRATGNPLATRALNADKKPKQYLLDTISDPAKSHNERLNAEELLSGTIPTVQLLKHRAKCPNCKNEEYFEIDPDTGETYCHCGETLKEPDT